VGYLKTHTLPSGISFGFNNKTILTEQESSFRLGLPTDHMFVNYNIYNMTMPTNHNVSVSYNGTMSTNTSQCIVPSSILHVLSPAHPPAS
jgi:hypothetical protein